MMIDYMTGSFCPCSNSARVGIGNGKIQQYGDACPVLAPGML